MCKQLLQSYERVGLGHDRRGGRSGKDSSQGRVAMSMAVASSLGTFSNHNSVHQTLFWFEKAAEAGYLPAKLFGRRAFEAHELPVPECLQPSKDAPAFESFSDMVQIAWSQFLVENHQKPIFARLGVSSDAITRGHDPHGKTARNVLEFVRKKFGNSEWLIEGKIHRIHLYCLLGCLEEVKKLVETHPHCVNIRMDVSGATPLLIACRYGYAEIALHLIHNQRAETSGVDEYGNNAFHYLFAMPESECQWECVADALIALTPDSTSMIVSQRTNKLIYLENLLLGLHGTPVEWAATSGNCRIVEYFASHVKLDRLLRHRVLATGAYLALPDLLEVGLKLDLELYAEWLSENQRRVQIDDGTISCHQMNLYGVIGMGTVSGIPSDEMGRTLCLCTSWIAHGAEVSSQYRKCIEVLGAYRVSHNKEFVFEPVSAVQRAILSGNTRLLDILLSMKFPLRPRGEQEKSGKDLSIMSRYLIGRPVSSYLAYLKRHDPADILPLFETLHKHGILLPPETSGTSNYRLAGNDLLLAALEMEFDSSGAGSLIFLLQYLLDNGYREVEDKDRWELALERASSITTLRFLLENGAKKYINERTRDHSFACYEYEHENHRCCQHKHRCANFLLDYLYRHSVDDYFEKLCKEILRVGGKTFLTGFHSHNILHAFINYRVDKGETDSSSEDFNKLILLPEIKAVVNQPDFLGATALQYAVVYGDEAMVRILLKAGANASYFNLDPEVPEPSVLVSHHLRFPPYFVIPGDFPSQLHGCRFHTRSLPSYHKSLRNIRQLLLQKGTSTLLPFQP